MVFNLFTTTPLLVLCYVLPQLPPLSTFITFYSFYITTFIALHPPPPALQLAIWSFPPCFQAFFLPCIYYIKLAKRKIKVEKKYFKVNVFARTLWMKIRLIYTTGCPLCCVVVTGPSYESTFPGLNPLQDSKRPVYLVVVFDSHSGRVINGYLGKPREGKLWEPECYIAIVSRGSGF